MTIKDIEQLPWTHEAGALIPPPPLSPLIADPSYIFPEESPDGKWHLFAHSLWGIVEHVSDDGVTWKRRKQVVRNGMRPFIRKIDSVYYLFYEKYRPLAMPLQVLPKRPAWRSTIQCVMSEDLKTWSYPVTVIEPVEPWTRDSKWGSSVSNPCLVETPTEWRLYYSASLVHVPDCGFEEPKYIAMASCPKEGGSPCGPFTTRAEPIIDPINETLPGALGAGAIKVLAVDDGYVGFQNKIYTDSQGHSRSAIFLLKSTDGIAWENALDQALISPDKDWMSTHVYACDCRYRASDDTWYLYFNARDGWHKTSGVERIGRVSSKQAIV